MAANDRNLAIAAFKAAADLAYQSGSKLRSRVTRAPGIMAESYRFPVFGPTDANVRGSGQDVTPAIITNAKPTAMLTPRESFSYLDLQDMAITNVNFMQTRGRLHGKAVAREWDADIIDVLQNFDANAYTRDGLTAVGLTITTAAGTGILQGGGSISADSLAKAISLLMNEDVGAEDPDECTLVCSADRFREFAAEEKFASMDYMQGGSITKTTKFTEIYGCTPVLIGQNARRAGHGRLPDNRAYVFARSAIGLAEGVTEKMGIVKEIPHKRSTMLGAEANGGATRIQNAGIVTIELN